MSARRLEGKIGLLTGGAGGMGLAHALRLTGEGAHVYVADVNDAGCQDTVAACVEAGGSASALHLDVSKNDEWESVVQQIERDHGRIDFLINNAGVLQLSAAEECSEAEWQRTIDINQKGVFLSLKHVVPLMKPTGGSIVNVSSIYGIVGSVGYIAYTASKGAVTVMTKSAAATYGEHGIRVNSIHPGVIFTKMLEEELSGLPESALDDFLEATPLRRGGAPAEVSGAVSFLVSEDSSFISGTEIIVDGGLLAAR